LDTIPLKKWKVKLWELKPDQTKRKWRNSISKVKWRDCYTSLVWYIWSRAYIHQWLFFALGETL
jgi:hypothetical protein